MPKNGILKKDGLVVYGEKEYKQLNFMDNITDTIKESMENNGFRKYIYNGKEIDNIWVKVDA